MAKDEVYPRLGTHLRRLSAGEQIGRLRENPGISERPPPDHDGIAAGRPEHAESVRRRRDVTVADDGETDRLLQLRDERPVGGDGVGFVPAPRVERNRVRPFLLDGRWWVPKSRGAATPMPIRVE